MQRGFWQVMKACHSQMTLRGRYFYETTTTTTRTVRFIFRFNSCLEISECKKGNWRILRKDRRTNKRRWGVLTYTYTYTYPFYHFILFHPRSPSLAPTPTHVPCRWSMLHLGSTLFRLFDAPSKCIITTITSHKCVIVWLHECMIVSLYHFTVVSLYDCIILQLYHCMIISLLLAGWRPS